MIIIISQQGNGCSVSTSSPTTSQHYFNSTMTLTKTTVTLTSGCTNIWEVPTIQYIMIGLGCGIGILICIIIMSSIALCTLSIKNQNTATIDRLPAATLCSIQNEPNIMITTTNSHDSEVWKRATKGS